MRVACADRVRAQPTRPLPDKSARGMKRLREILAALDEAVDPSGSYGSMHHAAAFDNQQLTGNEVAVGARQEQRRADDIGRSFDAPKGALVDAALASF